MTIIYIITRATLSMHLPKLYNKLFKYRVYLSSGYFQIYPVFNYLIFSYPCTVFRKIEQIANLLCSLFSIYYNMSQ